MSTKDEVEDQIEVTVPKEILEISRKFEEKWTAAGMPGGDDANGARFYLGASIMSLINHFGVSRDLLMDYIDDLIETSLMANEIFGVSEECDSRS